MRIVLFLLFLFISSIGIEAQTLILLRAEWAPNALTDNVISYGISVDSGPYTVVLPSTCSATVCFYNFSVTNNADHSISLVATNEWATSAPTTISFSTKAPGQPKIITIRKQ